MFWSQKRAVLFHLGFVGANCFFLSFLALSILLYVGVDHLHQPVKSLVIGIVTIQMKCLEVYSFRRTFDYRHVCHDLAEWLQKMLMVLRCARLEWHTRCLSL